MATQLQIRRGTTAQMNAFTGAEGELAVNTSTETVHVHDGSTAGGFALAKADGSNIGTYAGSFTTISASGAITGNVTGNLTGSVLTAAQTNITSVGTLSTLAVTGEITANGGIALGDNDKATFGASDDLQIYHDGSDSYIKDAGTGNLYLDSSDTIIRANGTENSAKFIGNGRVELYYDAVKKFETTSTGIDVAGTATMDGLTVNTSSVGGFKITNEATSGVRLTAYQGTTNSNVRTAYFDVQNFVVSTGSPTGTSVTEAMRITSGSLLVGKTAADSIGTDGIELDGANNRLMITRNNSEPLVLNRRGSDGNIAIFRKDGSAFASIKAQSGHISINAGTGTGKLEVGGVVRYNWDANQFYPEQDNARDLGFPSLRWDDVYSTGGINTSDRNEKQDIEELSDAEQRVAVACKGLMRKFRWKSAVIDKGDDARIHVGIMAQDLQAAFEAEGLDPARYGMWCSNTWTDEETGEEITRMSVRYNELLAFIIAAI
jgi:hypothetical protein